MAGQNDFVCFNPSSVDISSTSTAETAVLEYTADVAEDIDCILQSFSHGTPDSTPEKVIWRVYLGTSSVGGSPTDVTSTGIKALGRGSTGLTGTLKTGGTLPSLNNPAFREAVNQQSGYTNPQLLQVPRGTRLLVTAQVTASDGTVKCYARLVMRNPRLG